MPETENPYIYKNTDRLSAIPPEVGMIPDPEPGDVKIYEPSEDEPYMNEDQVNYFKKILLAWRHILLSGSDETRINLKEDNQKVLDLVDLGAWEASTALRLRTRERDRKLIYKIDEALERIKDGTYGFCEETGEEIGIRRLMARPVAKLCLQAQQRHEHSEKLKGKNHWK
jgi:DnaK suppressor protein